MHYRAIAIAESQFETSNIIYIKGGIYMNFAEIG